MPARRARRLRARAVRARPGAPPAGILTGVARSSLDDLLEPRAGVFPTHSPATVSSDGAPDALLRSRLLIYAGVTGRVSLVGIIAVVIGELIWLLMVAHVLLLRAAVVPSRASRTAWLGLASAALGCAATGIG